MRHGRSFLLWIRFIAQEKVKLSLALLICLFLSLMFIAPRSPSPVHAAGESWLTGYTYRRQITIDHTKVGGGTENESNFPVLISLTGLSNINTNGTDVRFTASDGSTQLPREIESYSSATGTLVAWVKVSTVSYTENTIIYMYYGKPGDTEPAASSTYGSEKVWTENYVGVWHLKETGTNPAVLDSTANHNNSASQTWTPAAGKIDGAGTFNGTSNSINITSNAGLNPTSITVSGWANADVNNKWQYMAVKNVQWDVGRDNDGLYYLGVWNASGTVVADVHATEATTEKWEYIVFTYDGSRAKYYVNNNAVINTLVTGNLASTDNIVSIGSQNGTGNYWDGSIDDVRVSNIARSAGWISTEYNNQNSPSTFATTGGQETETTPTPTPTSTSTPTPTSVPSASSSNTTSSSSPNGAITVPSCSDDKPTSIPDLFQIDSSTDSITLYFTPVSNASGYFISYSTNPSAEEYGVEVNLGREGVQSYTINLLSPGTTYYVKLRGQHGCMPGGWSAIKTAATQSVSSNLISASLETIKENLIPEKKLDIVSQELTSTNSNVCSYIVNAGDSLWSIALNKLGDSSKVQDLKELNNLTAKGLSVGQEIKLPCDKQEETTTKAKEEVKQEGIKLNVLVKDNNNHPLEGVTVTLHSIVQTAKTGSDGIAKFSDVEPGEHNVNLAYNDYKGEQKLTVDSAHKEQTLILQVQMNSGFASLPVMAVIIVMAGMIMILLVIILNNRRVYVKVPAFVKKT